jgi:hypothetical protein
MSEWVWINLAIAAIFGLTSKDVKMTLPNIICAVALKVIGEFI